ncbi:MAG: prolyl oligopeptidase family serine peptidase [Acidobacteriota bacterium]
MRAVNVRGSLAVVACFSLSLQTAAGAGGVSPDTTDARPAYPKARKCDQVDVYHGVRVADPYRWLEDPDSAESRAWIEAENALTSKYIGAVPSRGRIRRRLNEIWNFERYGVPQKRGNRYFCLKNDGLQNQSALYVSEGLDGAPRVLLDPNTLSPDGTVALAGVSPSEDGSLLAYGLSTSGSDWEEWKLRDVETGKDLPDRIEWIKFSGASWTPDGKGFYYSRYDEPRTGEEYEGVNYYQKVFFHKVGTSQSEDDLVYERRDQKEYMFSAAVTDDGRYLVLGVYRDTGPANAVLYKDLGRKDNAFIELRAGFDALYDFIDNAGPVLYFRTDLDAPRGRIVAIDTRSPEPSEWKELVPQAEEPIESVTLIGDTFVVEYLKDASSEIRTFDLQGGLVRRLELPAIGSVEDIEGRRKDREIFFSFESFVSPQTIYRCDVPTGRLDVLHSPRPDIRVQDFETSQVFYRGEDGTRIPMFITSRKGLRLDGNNPTYLYGYGGFNISMAPFFSVANMVWLEMGGVLAVPNLRGGGEYGEEWHRAGTMLGKQNVFDDFIAAAEYLIANKYTSSARLAIGGGSNGGLLVGACMTQRPDLFGAALPAVGVMDMLRFHKYTIGWAWTSDYGSSDDPSEFKALYAYSPLHRIKPDTSYPATLITTSDHDDRVVPAHSFKFAAALQAAQAGQAPVLIRIETKAGHGAGKSTTKLIEETADRWAFLTRVLGIESQVEAYGGHYAAR